jgi:ABC-type transporter Mla MlaB component
LCLSGHLDHTAVDKDAGVLGAKLIDLSMKLRAEMRRLTSIDMYLHDSATMFRLVLSGELSGRRVPDLEQAWHTAQSILNGKELVVDVSRLNGADEFGVELLARMSESGGPPDRGGAAEVRRVPPIFRTIGSAAARSMPPKKSPPLFGLAGVPDNTRQSAERILSAAVRLRLAGPGRYAPSMCRRLRSSS